MKILIIGSKGFIGSHLVQYFTKKNFDVWQCDVVVDYVLPQYFQVDASNADYLEIFETQLFDVCLNCSGAASVPDSLVHPQRDFTLNTSHVYKLLSAIQRYNAACKFVNLSSAAVYGNPTRLPIKETAELKPISPYGNHKLMAEMICKEFYDFFEINTCSLRIFSAYGNGLKKQLFWDLYHKMQNSLMIKMFGTGNETRDFIHVDDIARAIELIIQHSAFTGEVINVANGVEVSIKEVIGVFVNIDNWNGEIAFSGSERPGDPINWQADITLIKSFGYVPSMTMEQGLKNYIQWVKENN